MNPLLKILLTPLSFLYGVITLIRNRLYDANILKEKRFDAHTLSVGNLSVGGTGKTPHVEYLIRLLLKEQFTVATLSRGYKRKSSGFVMANEHSTADDIGDEPLIYKSKYPVQVCVDAKRVRGVENLLAQGEQTPNVILLDDAFQHRAIKCGLSIVVTEYNNLYVHDTMLPSGTLREYPSGMLRADVIVVSKTPENTTAIEMRAVLKDIHSLAYQRVFFSYLKYGELYSISNTKTLINTLNDLYRFRVISFAGIANAQPMINYLKEYAAEVRHLPFPDHHEFQLKDLEDIERYYQGFTGGNKILVSTEKDLMRLKNPSVWQFAKAMNIYILPVEVTFKDKEEEFNELILKYVRTNRIYHQKYST